VRRFEVLFLSISLLGFPVSGSAIQNQSTLTQPSLASAPASITVPAGTKVELVVTRPEWAHHSVNNTDFLLYDAGWQFQMILDSPLTLDEAQVSAAAATPSPN